MAWKVEDDAAWIPDVDGTYRHYSGARLSRRENLWQATAPDGMVLAARRSAGSAIKLADGFKELGFDRPYGDVVHPTGVIRDEGVRFAFISPTGAPFTPFVVTSLKSRFFGVARCIRCSEPMTEFLTAVLRLFDGKTSDVKTYLVCRCGYPVWHMELETYFSAQIALSQRAAWWRRKKDLKEAGGKHSKAEIRAILELQERRCIYCNALFTEELRPTRDHLIPLVLGGGDWALNIVMA